MVHEVLIQPLEFLLLRLLLKISFLIHLDLAGIVRVELVVVMVHHVELEVGGENTLRRVLLVLALIIILGLFTVVDVLSPTRLEHFIFRRWSLCLMLSHLE